MKYSKSDGAYFRKSKKENSIKGGKLKEDEKLENSDFVGKNGNNGVSKHSYNNIEKSMLTDREKLCLKIEGFSRYIIDTYPIYNPDVDTILSYLDDVKKPIHSINPQALVLTNLIITRYGISTEGVNFDRLNVFLANLISEYFIFDVIGSRNIIFNSVQNLLRIIQDLILSIKNNHKSEVERYFNMIISTINMIKLSKKEFVNFDNRIYGILEENEKFGNLLLTIKEVGKYNVDKLKSTSLDNLYSLEMLSKKYGTIRNHIQGSYDNDMQKMKRLVTTFLHGTDYSENWDGLSSVNFDNCIDIVKSIKVFL